MVAPLDIITPIHNAFRKGLIGIDHDVYEIAKKGGDLSPVLERLAEYNKYLKFHADGEEAAVFPALDKIAPHVATTFEMDHRELDVLSEGTEAIVGAKNELDAARATTALWTHLRIHLNKEDSYMYPALVAGVSEAEQAPIVGTMASITPHEEQPGLITWVMSNTTQDEREVINRVWGMLMPEPVYANVKKVVQASLTATDWTDLTKRIPELS